MPRALASRLDGAGTVILARAGTIVCDVCRYGRNIVKFAIVEGPR